MAVRIEPRPTRLAVQAATTSNLTLSGVQTITGVLCGIGALVAALGQSNGKNAVYLVQDGAWLPVDPNVGTGFEVYALQGTNAGKLYSCDTTGAIVWGTTSTAFTLKQTVGAAFDPAAPGALGVTTAGTVDSIGIKLQAASPTAEPTKVVLFGSGDGSTASARFGTGPLFAHRTLGAAGTIRRTTGAITLADDASVDITLIGGGHGTVSAPSASSSVFGCFSFAANGATSLNGVTYSAFDAADTDTKLCAFASGGNLRIRNRLGSSQTIVIDLTEGAA